MAVFVLVHGAWVGSAGYNPVAKLLRDKGHEVHTPSLTGLGERTHRLTPAIDLSLHIRDVAAVIDYQRIEEFVLVGHSYGGMVVTGISSLSGARIKSLVYLDAHLPDDGQALADLLPREERADIVDLQRETPRLVAPLMGPGDASRPRPRALHPLLTLIEPVHL